MKFEKCINNYQIKNYETFCRLNLDLQDIKRTTKEREKFTTNDIDVVVDHSVIVVVVLLMMLLLLLLL